MADQLTIQQKQAVNGRGGRLLVSAAAGSGKTKVLGDRLISYLTDPKNPANIDDFLLITYTQAAAAELRSKIAARLTQCVAEDPENLHLHRQMQRLYLTKISTVHSFCGDVLREYAYRLNLPGDFRVADENECNELRNRVVEQILAEAYDTKLEDESFCAFVNSQGLGRDDRQVPQIILQVYDSARCHLDPDAWLQKCMNLTRTTACTDAAETEYGQFLIQQLFQWLDIQIPIMEGCYQQAMAADGFEKPAALFADTIDQLKQLRAAQSWDQVVRLRQIDFGRLNFSKKCTDETLKEGMKAARDACKKGLAKKTRAFADESEKILRDLTASVQAVDGLIQLVQTFAQAYDQAKISRRVLDFSDLEHKMLDLLLGKNRGAPTVAAYEIGKRFREVMVDEYQDSNAVQDAIYHALTAKSNNLFLVGDVKQSIYQFRLADPGIFIEKYKSFNQSDADHNEFDRKVILSQNFRSSAGVLEGCNDVFRLCMSPQVGGMYYGDDEALNEGIPHIPLGQSEVELHCVDVQQETYPEEAAYVAAQIQQMLRHGTVREADGLRPVKPEDIAILLRSPGSTGIYFQRALEQCGIRYATGGGVNLFQTEEIGTLYALLQTIHNPRLDIPLIAVLLSPIFAFTADDLASLRSAHKSCAFIDAVRRDESEKSQAFMQTLYRLRGYLQYQSLTGLLNQILLETSMEEIYGAMEDGQNRLANIRTFFQLAVNFEASGNRDLGRFLEHLQSMEEKGLLSAGAQTSAGCVTIISIHKSKGLEYPVVFLCGLSRDFNMESQRATVLCHKEMGLGLSAVDEANRLRYPTIAKRAIAAKIGQDIVSEEMRVLYVAMTRARDRLIMTYASDQLENELTELVARLDMGGLPLLTQEASCPGRWVLLTALHKTEAGALFALAGSPKETVSTAHPWKITVAQAPDLQERHITQSACDTTIEEYQIQQIQQGLSFRYAHAPATNAPSKLTATGLKGRYKDEEVAEHTSAAQKQRQWREPSFIHRQMQGKDYGNALHAVMQHIQYTACQDVYAVKNEIERLRSLNYISDEQAGAVKAEQIATFFATSLGQKLGQGQVLREFKFSILQDGSQFDPALAGEKLLLQGVVDCALIEDDGITVIDFKTDYVTAQTLQEKVSRYAPQVQVYAQALEKIYEKKVKKRFLYFFQIGEFVAV